MSACLFSYHKRTIYLTLPAIGFSWRSPSGVRFKSLRFGSTFSGVIIILLCRALLLCVAPVTGGISNCFLLLSCGTFMAISFTSISGIFRVLHLVVLTLSCMSSHTAEHIRELLAFHFQGCAHGFTFLLLLDNTNVDLLACRQFSH